MRAFNVYLPSDSESFPLWAPRDNNPPPWPYTVGGLREWVEIDTVYYADTDSITEEEVYRALVDHDGYPHDIQVKEDVS